MKTKIILFLSLFLLLFTSCSTEKERQSDVSQVILSAEEELKKRDSFTADYNEVVSTEVEGKKVDVESISQLSILQKDSYRSKIETTRPSGLAEVEDSKITIYTLLNPDNDKEILEYSQSSGDSSWVKNSFHLSSDSQLVSGENALFIHERIWAMIRTELNKFKSLEENVDVEGVKADSYQAIFSKEELAKLMDPAQKEVLQSALPEKLALTIWIDKEKQLPIQIAMDFEVKASSSKMTDKLIYTGFDNIKDLTLPREISNP